MDAFVAEQEAKFGGDPGEHRGDYELLQLFDRLSLYFCLRDVEAGEAAELQGYRSRRSAPWQVRIDPFPFAEAPAELLAPTARAVEVGRRRSCPEPERVDDHRRGLSC